MSDGGLVIGNLTVVYGKATAVDGIDLIVPQGSVTALVGPNGAGKSSVVLGAYGSVAAGGTVHVAGNDVSNMSALQRARAGLALVPQGRQLFPKLTVLENLKVMADLLKLAPGRIDDALDRFPILRDRSGQLAGVLSGGEQQMLVVGRALMTEPSVLLLDEMMTGLAPRIVQQLAATVRELASSGVAVLLADPTLAPARHVVDRGYVLIRGRITAEAPDAAALDTAYQRAMGIIQREVDAEAAS